MEKFFFKKIELWAVLLVLLFLFASSILLAAAVRHYHLGGPRLGNLGPLVEGIAAFPSKVRDVLAGKGRGKADLLVSEQRFADVPAGMKFNYAAGSRKDLGFVLVNRYDGNQGYSVSELWDLSTQELIYTWSLSKIDTAWGQATLQSNLDNFRVDNASHRVRSLHADIAEGGTLLTHTGGAPLVELDLCSNSKIVNESRIFHHSLERDHQGNIWMPSRLEPKTVDLGSQKFLDDGITLVSPDGQVLFEKSVVQILDENSLGYLVFGKGQSNEDPIHLNDIEPVLEDGKYWKQGDVFLSLRHQSMILLYRPSTNQVIWHKEGPWLHQHDVNILSDEKISVFNNNAATTKKSDWKVRGVNNILVYDFRTNSVTSPWQAGFEKLELRTITEGRGTVSGNEVFVEETNYGRLVQFAPDGTVVWSYVNRADDGQIYRVNWSRLIPRGLGEQVREVIKKGGGC